MIDFHRADSFLLYLHWRRQHMQGPAEGEPTWRQMVSTTWLPLCARDQETVGNRLFKVCSGVIRTWPPMLYMLAVLKCEFVSVKRIAACGMSCHAISPISGIGP